MLNMNSASRTLRILLIFFLGGCSAKVNISSENWTGASDSQKVKDLEIVATYTGLDIPADATFTLEFYGFFGAGDRIGWLRLAANKSLIEQILTNSGCPIAFNYDGYRADKKPHDFEVFVRPTSYHKFAWWSPEELEEYYITGHDFSVIFGFEAVHGTTKSGEYVLYLESHRGH
jgi:hypothetical protein